MEMHITKPDQYESIEPEFADWRSYYVYANAVCTTSRYFWTEDVLDFVATVKHTMREREVELPEAFILYRAQLGWERDIGTREDGSTHGPEPYSEERMKPKENIASAGRANAQGIPVLYLAGDVNTAIAEVRPWIGSPVSLSQFKTVRKLKTLDLTRGFENTFLPPFSAEKGFLPIDAKTKEDAVWRDIDDAFSRPVSLDDNPTGYIPTQILSELFKREGFEALVYRSKLGEKGHNFVIFDLNDANPINFTCYDVEAVSIKESQAGNTVFLK